MLVAVCASKANSPESGFGRTNPEQPTLKRPREPITTNTKYACPPQVGRGGAMAYAVFYEGLMLLQSNRAKIPVCTSKLIAQNRSYSSDTVTLLEDG